MSKRNKQKDHPLVLACAVLLLCVPFWIAIYKVHIRPEVKTLEIKVFDVSYWRGDCYLHIYDKGRFILSGNYLTDIKEYETYYIVYTQKSLINWEIIKMVKLDP